ncbi:MAG: methyltransferase domain-containing protein [Eggerthellaceae bacterium]|nr:methyltransferase domain-containing protein [Eggerthellaceae bacterium]
MNINQAKRYVLDTVRAYTLTDDDGMRLIEPRLQRPLFLIGPPGIGKTAIMAQVASELGIGLVAYSMTHHTRQSALGLPVIEHRSYGDFEYDASEYTMSEIIATIYDYMRKTGLEQGILFLDEVNCVSETLYPSMLQFLQFKTFGAHAVPDGWIIACAGNPPEYNRSVHEFDVATMDRIRKIEIEPDLEAWKGYAVRTGVHPAVTTFLETEPDCFYRIEKKPGSTSFVTARGWDDLSRMLMLNERLEAPVEQDLIGQFVQDNEVAEKFYLYYELFSKYRSDYQVPAILAGNWPDGIAQRAREARLDERMALLGLLVDAIAPTATDVMKTEGALADARDCLRAVKGPLMEGGTLADTLDPAIEERTDTVRRANDAGAGSLGQTRKALRALNILKACRNACAAAGLDGGDEAFMTIHQEFRGHAGAFEASVGKLRTKIDNAFAFLEEAFGEGNETLLFTTELVTRRPCAMFIAHYGSEGFERSNANLQTTGKRADLVERIEAADTAGTLRGDAHETLPAPAAAPVAMEAPESPDELRAYYENARWEYGYASLCHVTPPAGLEGKTLLDMGCRRGKGAFKFSERVGERGHVIGIDWVADHIAEAQARAPRAARETGLPANNMEFHLAYPEDLMVAGIGSSTIDVAFVNSVLHLTCRPADVLAELHRVLKPGGLLVLEVALAQSARDASVVEAARAIGNSIQAAPCQTEFEALLDTLGFDVEVAVEGREVAPDEGYKKNFKVPCAPSNEDIVFEALVLHARKR